MVKEIKKLNKERYLLSALLLLGSYLLLVTRIYQSILVLLLFICLMIYFSIIISNLYLLNKRSKFIMMLFILIDNFVFFQTRLSGISIYMYLFGLFIVWYLTRKDEGNGIYKSLLIYTIIKLVFIILLMIASGRMI